MGIRIWFCPPTTVRRRRPSFGSAHETASCISRSRTTARDLTRRRRGSGLTNMADRLEALGGGIDLDSKPGSGTRLRGRLPIPVLEVVA
jgi:hypothetical protein